MVSKVMFLGLIAVVLAVIGVVQILSGNIGWGIILLIAACAVGPGGWAIYK